ncbi:MAG TPA: bifunctional UDP-N-acetylglucosamine diphosphorylase/glucosamine-1-phosphate N-acetyltransferase GlmU [Anaerolineales bacterium]
MSLTEAVVLAAGHGTRMKSATPKVLHPLLGQPMLQWVVEACRQATGRPVTLVVGADSDGIREAVSGDVRFAVQAEQLGTGHALRQTQGTFADEVNQLLVVNADLALLTAETLVRLIEAQSEGDSAFSLLTARSSQGRGFGRLIRDQDGHLLQILEAAHATDEQLAIDELNVGVYCFDVAWLWDHLPKIEPSPKGEYYLTDLVEIAGRQGASMLAVELDDLDQTIGINNRVHLAEAEAALRHRLNQRWMLAGVTLQDPNSTFIGPRVELAQDVVILANTHLEGATTVGEATRIGPNSIVRDSRIGSRCRIEASVVEGAVLENDIDVGPFSHLRKGAHLEDRVHIGNYGEVKNSRLGRGVKMGHFSYMGDATVGADANIGAGTITCNFDGKQKHDTEIGEGAFIGSDTMLVAPVKIGKGARTGAGAVVTKDVPDGSIAVGVPARVIRKVPADHD